MSWSEDWSSLSDLADEGGATAYARGAILSAGARAGASIASVTRALRSAGIGYRAEQVSATYGTIRQAYAAGRTASALALDSSTGQLLPSDVPANWTGQYVYRSTAIFRTRDEQGNYSLESRAMSVKSSVLLTPWEISQQVLGIMETPPEPGTTTELPDISDLLSTSLTGAWYDTGGQRGGYSV